MAPYTPLAQSGVYTEEPLTNRDMSRPARDGFGFDPVAMQNSTVHRLDALCGVLAIIAAVLAGTLLYLHWPI